MKDKELEKILEIASNQSEKFFKTFNFEHNKKIVYKKIENRNYKKDKLYKINRFFVSKKVFLKNILVTCLVILVALISYHIGENDLNKIGTPILQQVVKLDDTNNNHLVNYFLVDNPDKDNNLLAVLWQKDLKGNYHIIYSSILENTDIPYPVSIMNIPSSQSKFALVSSSNKEKNFIHYRLIKYYNNSTQTYIEENFVPEGKVQIDGGVVIEERVIPKDYFIEEGNKKIIPSSKLYRYYIPVVLKEDGGVVLTTNRITLKKGSILTLLPDDRIMPLEFDYNDEIISIKNNVYSNDNLVDLVNFETIKEGFVKLKIREKDKLDTINEILIEIID